MPGFPSSSGTRQQNLSEAWASIRNIASNIKQRTVSLNTQCAAGPVGSSAILDFATFLADAKLMLSTAASISGLGAYAQAQIGDATFDVVASFNTMVAQIDASTAWIITNFPNSGGMLLAKSFAVDNSGRTQDAQFSSSQTAGLRTILTALAATID